MKASDVSRAVAAAKSIAARCDLPVDEASVVQNSNKLALRLSPCDALARVAYGERDLAQFEVELARALAESEGCPVAALDPRVAPRVYEQDGFAITLWTYYESPAAQGVSPGDYATALRGLHAVMRRVAVEAPHFTDRVAEAQQLVSSPDRTQSLADVDRELLNDTLGKLRRSILERDAPEQLIHGEPHPGNLLGTRNGPLFIDLETCCRGPVEFDLAHVPEAVSGRFPEVDRSLLDDCRGLALAMVAAWRWDRDDEFPDGRREGQRLLGVLRKGPPWPAPDA